MIKNVNKNRKAVMVLLLAAVMVISFLFSNDMTTISFADGAEASGECGDSATWSLSDGVLTISGTGDMEDYSFYDLPPWYSYWNEITKVVIEDGITNVGEYAFIEFTNLTEATIADSVTEIGISAFEGCTSLNTVEMSESLTLIDDYAFYKCSALTGINLSGPLQEIGSYAFYNCTSLTEIDIPDTAASIGEWAFYNCSSLASVTLPESLLSIEERTFYKCTSLKSITIPSQVTEISDKAFYYDSSLHTIYFDGDAPSLGSNVFSSSIVIYYYPDKDGWEEAFDTWADSWSDSSYVITWVERSASEEETAEDEEEDVSDYVFEDDSNSYSTADTEYSYQIKLVNPYCEVYTPTTMPSDTYMTIYALIYVATDNPSGSGIRLSSDGSWSYGSIASTLFPDLGDTTISSYYITVDGGYLFFVEPDEAGEYTFEVKAEGVLTGATVTFTVHDYEEAYYDWMDEIIEDTGVNASTMSVNEVMTELCDYLSENYAYYTNYIDDNGDVYGWYLFSEYGTHWQNQQLDSRTTPRLLSNLAEYLGIDGISMVSTDSSNSMHGYVKYTDDDGNIYYYTADSASPSSGRLSADDIVEVSLDDVYATYGEHVGNYSSTATYFTCARCGKEKCKVTSSSGSDDSSDETGSLNSDDSSDDTGSLDSSDSCEHSYEIVSSSDATCTQDGTTVYQCSLCGDTYTKTIAATGHSYVSSVTDPTCTEQGYTTYTCSVCGDSYMANYTDAAGHSYTSKTTTAATCTTTGVKTYTCSVCGDTYTETIAATGHSYTGKVTTTATCTTTGVKTYTCSVCGDSYTETIAATGHTYSNNICSTCGALKSSKISSATVTLSTTSYTYSGSANKPTPTVKINGTTLTKGTDYTVSYSNNTNAGTATVTITGKGSYSGTKSVTFTINKKSVSSATVTLSATSYTYSGSARKPTPTVKVNSKTLTKDTDYTVSYSSNTNIGTATVKITGTGNYSGSLSKTFTIKPGTVKISSASSSAAKKLTVKWSKLSGSVKYQIAYKKNSSSSWSYTTVGSTTYSKTLSSLSAGTKYNVKVRAYKTVSGKTYYGSWSSTKTVTVKKAQTLTVKTATKTASYTKVKKSAQTVKPITSVSGAKGTVTYTKSSGKSYFTVNKSTGKVTVKKGTPKGTYTVKIRVSSASTSTYASASKTVTVTIKVK